MAKHKLSQAWVDRATAEPDDIVTTGSHLGTLPTLDDLSAVFSLAAGSNAVREMIRRKWFQPSALEDKVLDRSRALGEFIFPRKGARPVLASSMLFRRHLPNRDLIEEISTMAWLSRIVDVASSIDNDEFKPDSLDKKSINHLVRLSVRPDGPRKAIKYLEELGIAIVLESSLPGMRADAASFLLSLRQPVIALTLRFDRLDSFWFTLLHEIAHIVLHLHGRMDQIFIDSLDEEENFLKAEVEAEADAFAKDSFIPRDVWLRSDAFRFGTESSIVDLAKKCGIHPSIVAGRIRYEKKRFNAYTHLLGAGQIRSQLFTE